MPKGLSINHVDILTSPLPLGAPLQNKNSIVILLQTDGSVGKMSWEIKDLLTDNVIRRGSGYDPNSSYTVKVCLPIDSCHSFTIYNWTYPYYLIVNNDLLATGSEVWGNEGESTEIGCDTLSPSGSPSRAPCDINEIDVEILLDTDGDGGQTKWDIVNNPSRHHILVCNYSLVSQSRIPPGHKIHMHSE